MRTASCPSCGAPVTFQSRASVFAVCEFCQSTLVSHDGDLQNLGRMAALLEDTSPLQLGAEGVYRSVHFAVIGRIQLRYGQGVWNEWHLLFDDQRNGWLSDAAGQCIVTFARWVAEPLPAFTDLQIEQPLLLDGQRFQVTNLERATCVAGAGELPFRIGPGYPAPVADLRTGSAFATLDYSDVEDGKPPLVFIGEAVDWASLRLTGVRDGAPEPGQAAKLRAKVLRCPSCGAPMSLHSGAIETVACASCSAVLSVADENLRIVLAAQGAMKEKPALPLGSKGTLGGTEYEVIGMLRRRTVVEGEEYAWREYLLLHPQQGFRWLTEYNGHWSFVTTLDTVLRPDASGKVRHEGAVFEHFQSAQAEVDYVLGEFYWQVTKGDVAQTDDYVAPPRILSRERSASEVTWSLGEYLEPETIAAAFHPPAPLPPRIGVGASQPCTLKESHRTVCRWFWGLALAALVIQLSTWLLAANKVLLQQYLTFSPGAAEQSVATETFQVPRTTNLHVRNRADLNNDWVELNLTLVNKDNGANFDTTREISYYEGYEDGESWSEGSREDEVVFRQVPPGTYYLLVDADLAQERRSPMSDTLEVVRDRPVWSNLFLALMFLALFPVYSRWRLASFEIRRWADSDHPKITSSSDDD
jgi:ribosomal protein S27E